MLRKSKGKRRGTTGTARAAKVAPPGRGTLPRAFTGIEGLDEITEGGLPKGAPPLVCGPAGSGKTVLALQFAAEGASRANEPAVYLSFEETRERIVRNLEALGHDPAALEKDKKLRIEYVDVAPHPQEEIGDFDLSGLFVRLGYAIDQIGAKRVVIDGSEALFSAMKSQHVLRRELARLLRWLDQRNVTSLVTGEQGQGTISRHGFEEYLADCVISLDYKVKDQLAPRRLRIVKYRGAPHSTDEYPFLIAQSGICVLPLTSLGLNHSASSERISTGIPTLDEMFGGKGFYRGSSVLISGTAGTGKSSIAATFVSAACARGENATYFAFEESQDQIVRNMQSIGLNLGQWVRKGLLCFETSRPTIFGLESHLANIQTIVRDRKPRVVVIDPITNFSTLGSASEVRNMLMRLIDFLKTEEITGVFTSLTEGGSPVEQSSVGVSSLIDTWLLVRDIETSGERNRGLYVLKSRGMAHSNQIREFVITDRGLELVPVLVGGDGTVFIGAARAAKAAHEAAVSRLLPETERLRKEVKEQRQQVFQAEIAAMEARFAAAEKEAAAEEILHEGRELKAARIREEAHRTGKSLE